MKNLLLILVVWATVASVHAESQIRAKIIWVKGNATYSMYGESYTSVSPLMSVPENTAFRTSKESQVLLGLVPGVNVLVRSNSEVEIKELGYYSRSKGFVYKVLLEIKKGSVIADVVQLMPPSRFLIQTKQGVFESNHGSMFVSYRDGAGYAGVFGGKCKATLANGKEYVILSATAIEINGESPELLTSDLVAFRYDELLELQATTNRIRALVEFVNVLEKNKDAQGNQAAEASQAQSLLLDSNSTPVFNDIIQAIYEETPGGGGGGPGPVVSPVLP